jgi:hypothetical protein
MIQNSRKQSASAVMPAHLDPEQWESVWKGHRAADKDELFILYRRKLQ